MRSFLYFCSVLIFVLAIGGAIAPYFVGKLAHKHYTNVVKEISELQGVTAEVVDYKGGYLESQAVTKITLHDLKLSASASSQSIQKEASKQPSIEGVDRQLKQMAKPMVIKMVHHFKHGPIIFTHDGSKKDWKLAQALVTTHLDEALKEALDIKGDQSINKYFSMKTFFDIHGYLDIEITGQAYQEHDIENESLVEWGGISAKIVADSSLKRVNGVLVMPKLRVLEPRNNTFFILTDLQSTFKMNKNLTTNDKA